MVWAKWVLAIIWIVLSLCIHICWIRPTMERASANWRDQRAARYAMWITGCLLCMLIASIGYQISNMVLDSVMQHISARQEILIVAM